MRDQYARIADLLHLTPSSTAGFFCCEPVGAKKKKGAKTAKKLTEEEKSGDSSLDIGKGKPKRTRKTKTIAPQKSVTKDDSSDEESDSETQNEDSDDGGVKPPPTKHKRSATNPHEERKRKSMDRFQPALFRQYASKTKNKLTSVVDRSRRL